MNRFLVISTIVITTVLSSIAQARNGSAINDDAATLASCPLQGDAKNKRVRKLNILKRRMSSSKSTELDNKVTLATLVESGNDTDRFDTSKGATIDGYVIDSQSWRRRIC